MAFCFQSLSFQLKSSSSSLRGEWTPSVEISSLFTLDVEKCLRGLVAVDVAYGCRLTSLRAEFNTINMKSQCLARCICVGWTWQFYSTPTKLILCGLQYHDACRDQIHVGFLDDQGELKKQVLIFLQQSGEMVEGKLIITKNVHITEVVSGQHVIITGWESPTTKTVRTVL